MEQPVNMMHGKWSNHEISWTFLVIRFIEKLNVTTGPKGRRKRSIWFWNRAEKKFIHLCRCGSCLWNSGGEEWWGSSLPPCGWPLKSSTYLEGKHAQIQNLVDGASQCRQTTTWRHGERNSGRNSWKFCKSVTWPESNWAEGKTLEKQAEDNTGAT